MSWISPYNNLIMHRITLPTRARGRREKPKERRRREERMSARAVISRFIRSHNPKDAPATNGGETEREREGKIESG